MMSLTATILNITVTHLQNLWTDNTRMIGYWSRDPLLVSNEINKIEKRIKRIWIITNVVLPRGWGIAVLWTRDRSDSRVIEGRDTEGNNNIGGTSPPSNNSSLI